MILMCSFGVSYFQFILVLIPVPAESKKKVMWKKIQCDWTIEMIVLSSFFITFQENQFREV